MHQRLAALFLLSWGSPSCNMASKLLPKLELNNEVVLKFRSWILAPESASLSCRCVPEQDVKSVVLKPPWHRCAEEEMTNSQTLFYSVFSMLQSQNRHICQCLQNVHVWPQDAQSVKPFGELLHLYMWNWVVRVKSVSGCAPISPQLKWHIKGKWLDVVEMSLLPPLPVPASVKFKHERKTSHFSFLVMLWLH